MAPPDDDLLLHIHTPDARELLHDRFSGYLLRIALNLCIACGLTADDAQEVVAIGWTKVLDPKTGSFAAARMKPGGCTAKQYLTGVVRNAFRKHVRFRGQVPRRSEDTQDAGGLAGPDWESRFRRHDWTDPANAEKGYPNGPEEIVDPAPDRRRRAEEAAELVSIALRDEADLTRKMVRHYHLDGLTLQETADAIGVASHTTVMRRLDQFYARARLKLTSIN